MHNNDTYFSNVLQVFLRVVLVGRVVKCSSLIVIVVLEKGDGNREKVSSILKLEREKE